MLSRADHQRLHDLKHKFELQSKAEDYKSRPNFSKEKVRHRRLKNLENRHYDQRYEKLKTLFENVEA